MTSSKYFTLQGESDMIRKGHSEEKTNRGQGTMCEEPDLKDLAQSVGELKGLFPFTH